MAKNFGDVTPNTVDEYWTVALVEEDRNLRRETHFGVLPFEQARDAMESGRVRVQEGQHLELRRIRKFPA